MGRRLPGGRLRVAVVGCGDVSGYYAAGIVADSGLLLAGAFDVAPGPLAAFRDRWRCRAYGSLDELLSDPSVDAVLNVTPPRRHHEVTRACLLAGKHVHSEKPLAMTPAACDELTSLARTAGLRLGVSPFVHYGDAQQAVWRLLREGACGTVRMMYGEANQGRIERRHAAPERVYDVGPLWDVGIYPLAVLTAFLGPVLQVSAESRRLMPERSRPDGTRFEVGAYDWITAVLDLRSGAAARVTASLYVGAGWRRVTQFHGDVATVQIDDYLDFASPAAILTPGQAPTSVPLPTGARHGVSWAWPLAELNKAISEGRSHRAGPEHAHHLVEVMCAIESSARGGRSVQISSEFPLSAPDPA